MEVAQLCPILYDPMDCSPPGSSVHRILQASILEWDAIPFSWKSSQPRDRTQVSCIAVRFFTIWAIRETLWATRKGAGTLKEKPGRKKVRLNFASIKGWCWGPSPVCLWVRGHCPSSHTQKMSADTVHKEQILYVILKLQDTFYTFSYPYLFPSQL